MMKTLQPRRVGLDVNDRVSRLAGKFLDEVSRRFTPSLGRDAIECSFSIVEPPLPESFYTEPTQGYAVKFVFNFAGSREKHEVELKYRELADTDAATINQLAREVVARLAFMKYLQNQEKV